jgi:phage-related protein
MASKTTYETIFALGAKIQNSLPKSFGTAQKNIKNTQSATEKASQAFNKLSKTVKTAITAVGAYAGIQSVKSFLNDSIDAAKKQIEVERKLSTVLVQRTQATEDQIQAILDLTSAQEKIGIIGGEVQVAGAQQLATFVSQTESVEALVPAMNNLLAQQKGFNASESDAVSIGNMMGKVLQGQTSALTRVGISFTEAQEQVLKYGSEQERAAMLAQVITDNVGEMNKSMGELDEAKILQSNARLDDMRKTIGKKLLPIQAKFYAWFSSKVPAIEKFVVALIDNVLVGTEYVKGALDKAKPHFEKLIEVIRWMKDVALESFNNIQEAVISNQPVLLRLQDVIQDVGKFLKEAFEKAKPIIEWIVTNGLPEVINVIGFVVDKAIDFYEYIRDNWELIGPIVYGIVGALTTYKTIILVITAITKGVTLVTTGFGAAMGFLTSAMVFLTSPIGIVVVAVGALIAVGVLLYKNWDKVKGWLIKIMEGIKTMAVNIFNGIVDFLKEWGPIVLAVLTGPFGIAVLLIIKNFDNIKEFFLGVGESLKNIVLGIVDFFSSAFQGAYDGIIGIFGGIGEFFSGIFDGVTNVLKGSVNAILSVVNYLIKGINKISFKVPDWVPGIGGKDFGFNIPEIPKFATGGIVKHKPGGILANIGEGKEDEAVLPLSKLDKLLKFGSKSSHTNETLQVTYAPTYNVSGSTSKKELEDVAQKALDDFERKLEVILYKKKRLQFG